MISAGRTSRPRSLERLTWGLFLFVCLAVSPARAHDRSVSQSVVSVDGRRVVVRVRSRLVDLSALSQAVALWAHSSADAPVGDGLDRNLPAELVQAFAAHYRVLDDTGQACPAAPPARLPAAPGELTVRVVYECNANPARYVVEPWPVPGHHHMAHTTGDDRSVLIVGQPGELPLTAAAADTAADGGGWDAALAYLRYGATHAATGWDHALFVLLLLAYAARARDAAVLVTGFTLGHGLTLALAALAVLESRGRAVEALIAASVVLVAAENIAYGEGTPTRRAAAPALVAIGGLLLGAQSGERVMVYFALVAACSAGLLATAFADPQGRPPDGPPQRRHAADDPRAQLRPGGGISRRVRLGLAVGFGLVHGLGFASGFDADGPHRVPRLLAFNLGVELAQLGWLALAWPLLRWLGAPDAARRVRAVRLGSVAAGGFAAYACALRALSFAPG